MWLLMLVVAVTGVGGFLLGYSGVGSAPRGKAFDAFWLGSGTPWTELDEDCVVSGAAWEPLQHHEPGSSFKWPADRAWDASHGVTIGGCTNPATGLPMLSGDSWGIDAGGNHYGLNDTFCSHGSWDHGGGLDTVSSFSPGYDWL